MRVEHLYELAEDLLADLKQTKMASHFEELTAALQNQVNGPNADHQNAISKKLTDIRNAAATSRTNKYPANWRQELVALDLAELFGTNLVKWIQEVLQRNQITHNVALEEANKIKKHLTDVTQTLTELVKALRYLEFEAEELDPGEYEVAVVIPRPAVENELSKFSAELRRLNLLFGVFSELVTGSRDQFKIRAISSSDLSIFLEALPEVAEAIANALQKVVTLYGGILGIVLIHRQLQQHKVSKEIRELVKKEIDAKVSAGIHEIASDFENQYFEHIAETRRTELSKQLRDALSGIARRLDEGYGFDIRGEPPEEPAKPKEGEALDPNVEQLAAKKQHIYEVVTEARQVIRVFAPEGEPVLRLTRDVDDPDDTK